MYLHSWIILHFIMKCFIIYNNLLRFSGCDKEMNTLGSTKVSKLCVSILNFKYNNGNIYVFVYYIRDVWLNKKCMILSGRHFVILMKASLTFPHLH